MNILLLLGLLTLTVPAPVHAADKSGEPPAIRYFQYWVRYGEKAARPGGYVSLSFELMQGRMNIFAPDPAGNFCGPADSSVIRDFSVLAAGLDLTDWAGESGKDPFSLPEKERERSCVWSLTIIFAENGRGNAPGKIRISGSDDGTGEKRLRAEAELLRFFADKAGQARATAPRTPASLLYSVKTDGKNFWYTLDADDGMVRLSARGKDRNVTEYVSPKILGRLNAWISEYGIDRWNGFTGAGYTRNAEDAFTFSLSFDTQQTVSAQGRTGIPGGTPPRFAGAEAELRRILDSALGPAAGDDVSGFPLSGFSYAKNGTSLDSHVVYKIYRRVDDGLPHMILSFKKGRDPITEVIMDRKSLEGFADLIRELGLSSWNGFRGNNPNVLDGSGFGLSVSYPDGRSISASGHNAFPKDYGKRTNELCRYLNGLLEETDGARNR